jgi:hypothetical protein
MTFNPLPATAGVDAIEASPRDVRSRNVPPRYVIGECEYLSTRNPADPDRTRHGGSS